MQYVMLKSGLTIRFYPEKVQFSFNEKGWFVGDVGLRLLPETGFRPVESFTFHKDEISAHWME